MGLQSYAGGICAVAVSERSECWDGRNGRVVSSWLGKVVHGGMPIVRGPFSVPDGMERLPAVALHWITYSDGCSALGNVTGDGLVRAATLSPECWYSVCDHHGDVLGTCRSDSGSYYILLFQDRTGDARLLGIYPVFGAVLIRSVNDAVYCDNS